MNRSHIMAAVVLLIAVGWAVWLLRLGDTSGTQSSAPHRRLPIPPAYGAGSAWLDTGNSGTFAFAHKGARVSLDLTQVRRSHSHLVREDVSPFPGQDAKRSMASAPDPAFDFLSWPGRHFVGEETIKTRRCWVVDFKNPAPDSGDNRYGTVRIFVDKQLGVLMRMTGYNAAGKRVLNYAVISGKRVNGALAVGAAEARHYEPGTSHVVQEVTYRIP